MKRRLYRLTVISARFSPDGHELVTASWDETARVWSADGSGAPIVLEGHRGRVESASFSPDGRRVVTASLDGTARVWALDPAVLQSHLEAASAACISERDRVYYLGETPQEARQASEACERSHGR